MGRGRRTRPRKLAGKLLEVRSRLNIGQLEMARRLQTVDKAVYPGMISRFEHGKIEPSLLVLLEYARLGSVSMEVLVNDKLKLPAGKEKGKTPAG
jgi:transcriptional regulator with XRE-family HTH domain